MQEIILAIIDQFGYLGILFLLAVETIFPPIPSEVILTFGGFATTFTSMTFLGVVIVSTIGSVLGALALYFLGLYLNLEKVEKLFNSNIGKKLHLKVTDLNKAQKWFDKYGEKTVFFGRFIPIVRSLVSIPAGMAKMSLTSFMTLTIIGSTIWNVILIYLGRLTGKNWAKVVEYFELYSHFVLYGIIAALLLLVGYLFYKKYKIK